MLVRNAELCSAEKVSSSSTIVIYDVNKGDKRPANLLRTFGELYSVARLETLDELDTIEELVDADELKNKLLFSVVVVSITAKYGPKVNPVHHLVCRSYHSAPRWPPLTKSENK